MAVRKHVRHMHNMQKLSEIFDVIRQSCIKEIPHLHVSKYKILNDVITLTDLCKNMENCRKTNF